MSDKKFDVVVIGGGPAGYPAAIRAAQLGLSAACIDDYKNEEGVRAFGGTCLNVGCIPSKALLESTELYHRAQTEFDAHGIKISGVGIDVGTMQTRKRGIVQAAHLGRRRPVQGGRRHGLQGPRQAASPATASRSRPTRAWRRWRPATSCSRPAPRRSSCRSRSSTASESSTRPVRSRSTACRSGLGVIGAGVIGLELGSVWRRLGSEVVILEALDTFLPMADQQVAKEGLRHFKRQGLDIRLGAKVTGAAVQGDVVKVELRERRRGAAARGRRVGRRRGPATGHGGLVRPGRERAARQARLHRGRRAMPHERAERLGRRRRRPRPHARAQGHGRGRHGGRADRGPRSPRSTTGRSRP